MIYVPESLSRTKQTFVKWKETGTLQDEEIVIIPKNGDRRTVLLSAETVKDRGWAITSSRNNPLSWHFKKITERLASSAGQIGFLKRYKIDYFGFFRNYANLKKYNGGRND